MENQKFDRELIQEYAKSITGQFLPIVSLSTVYIINFFKIQAKIGQYYDFINGKLYDFECDIPMPHFIYSGIAELLDEAKRWKSGSTTGLKYDNEKPRMDLLPFDALVEVSKNLTYGAKKYKPNSWQNVPDAENRYQAALLRHLAAIKAGERIDPESGISHYACLATNALFLCSLDCRKTNK